MSPQQAVIEVYGANIMCASCVNAPSSIDTYEWLQAALARKFPEAMISYRYVDIEGDFENARDEDIASRIQEDEFFYPLVLVDGEVVGEGYIELKPIVTKLQTLGIE
jgi:disulfide oxidoreductase YuzD